MSRKYPELDKIQSVKEDSQKLGEFLSWLLDKYDLCELKTIPYEGTEFYPVHRPINEILAEYFEIDLNKADEERMQILENIRKVNGE